MEIHLITDDGVTHAAGDNPEYDILAIRTR